MGYQGSYTTVALATIGVLGGAYCVYKLYKKPQKLPTEWKEVGRLTELHIYPIKSVGPVILNKAECTLLGLKDGWLRDRVLMVVDEKNNFITARIYPELLFVKPEFRGSILNLKHENMESIDIDLAEVVATKHPELAQVWGVTVPVFDCGMNANEWFSRLLKRAAIKFKLVLYASEKCRTLKNPCKFFNLTKNDTGALSDEISFNMMNEASVEDLNSRMNDCKVLPSQFRSNFLLSGAKPYEEDNWRFIKIGETIFELVKPCFRCVLITLDPKTGARHAKSEPLKTLKNYRQIDDPAIRRMEGNAPRLGMQLALRSPPGGIVNVNDTVYAA